MGRLCDPSAERGQKNIVKQQCFGLNKGMNALIDITVPIHGRMPVWPTDAGVSIEQVQSMARGDAANVTALQLGAHSGTHVDAFYHFKPDGKRLDEMDLSVYIGPALVMEFSSPQCVTLQDLQNHPAHAELHRAERLIIKTVNSGTAWWREPFNENFCYLAPGAAEYLASLENIRLVGIDYLSVESFHALSIYGEAAPTHQRLIKADIYIVEGLKLDEVAPGWYELICLPLKIENGDGSPARVVLRPLKENAS